MIHYLLTKKLIVDETTNEIVIVNDLEVVWEQTKLLSRIDEDFFFEYYDNRSQAVAYKLTGIQQYHSNKELSDYGITHAPQSFVYV